jgi:pimeloyl-ACP methyl ester carboxylesterase
VAGSGPTDRDGNNPLIPIKIDTLKEIAHFLSSHGIATLRYDKRGIKDSSELVKGGTPSFNTYKIDVISVTKYLKKQSIVNEDKVFLLGHSEGAILSIMATEEQDNLAGIILISGPGFPMAETLRGQIENIGNSYAKQGQEKVKEELLTALDDLYTAIRSSNSFDISQYDIPKELRSIYLSLANQPNFVKDWIDVNPTKLLAKTKVPVCIIQGTNDSRVGANDAHKLASVVPNNRLDLNIIEGVNHFLKEDNPGNYSSDKSIYRPILDKIYNFIQ